MTAKEHSKAPTERTHSHSSSADPELPLHHPPSIPLSIAPFIPLLIPLSNSSLSFHLRSNNISNPYFQPAIPPMAISARALEIFNTLYPQFGWVILTKFFVFFREWRLGGNHVLLHEHMMLTGFSVFFLFFLFSLSFILSFFFSLCHRWTDQSRWSQQTVRAGEVLYAIACFFYFSPPLLPSFFCSNPTNMLPVRINLTIMCPIRRSPVPRHRLTARPGKTLQYSEHIMLTVFFLAGEDSSSFSWRFIICIDACTCKHMHWNTCVLSGLGEKTGHLFCHTTFRTLSVTNVIKNQRSCRLCCL